jgi:protein TonB
MTTKKFTLISLLAHAAFLLIIVLTLHLPLPPVMGTIDQPIISSHLVTAQNIAAKQPPKPIHTALALTPNTPTRSAPHTPPTTSKGEPAPALAALLHSAIARQQQYPASAQEQQREGRVTLAFTLFPDGSISNLHIAHSSGTTSLDHAALASVDAAIPFQHVNRYLKTAENYQVDVVFELT